MSEALPVLVDCDPYHLKLTARACVSSWWLANKVWKKGDGRGKAAMQTARLRYGGAYCIDCPAGESRADDLPPEELAAIQSNERGAMEPTKDTAAPIKQGQLPGTEDEQDPVLSQLAVDYVKARDARMRLADEEVDAREALAKAMKERKRTVYRDLAHRLIVEMTLAGENLKVANAKAAETKPDAG